MLKFETECRLFGAKFVCGIDEAGRGPLFGPVYAAAVILSENDAIEGVNDSKKLSEKKREELFEEIISRAICWNAASATAAEIDEINILQATFLAMRRAVEGLDVKPDFLLIDGNRSPGIQIQEKLIIGGDGLSASIAAASIVAKVLRDREMKIISEKHPEYGFSSNKGYPTAAHFDALRKFGPIQGHRMSFLKKLFENDLLPEGIISGSTIDESGDIA